LAWGREVSSWGESSDPRTSDSPSTGIGSGAGTSVTTVAEVATPLVMIQAFMTWRACPSSLTIIGKHPWGIDARPMKCLFLVTHISITNNKQQAGHHLT